MSDRIMINDEMKDILRESDLAADPGPSFLDIHDLQVKPKLSAMPTITPKSRNRFDSLVSNQSIRQSPHNTPLFDMEAFYRNTYKKKMQDLARNRDLANKALKTVEFTREINGPTLFSDELDQEKPGWKFLHDSIFNPARQDTYRKIVKEYKKKGEQIKVRKLSEKKKIAKMRAQMNHGVTQMVHKKIRDVNKPSRNEGGPRQARRGVTMALPNTLHVPKPSNLDISDDKKSLQAISEAGSLARKRQSIMTQGREENQASQENLENDQENLLGTLEKRELQKGLVKKVQHDLTLKVRDTSVGNTNSPPRSQTVQPAERRRVAVVINNHTNPNILNQLEELPDYITSSPPWKRIDRMSQDLQGMELGCLKYQHYVMKVKDLNRRDIQAFLDYEQKQREREQKLQQQSRMGSKAGAYSSRLGKMSRISGHGPCCGEEIDYVPQSPKICKYIHDRYGQTIVHGAKMRQSKKDPIAEDTIGQDLSPNNSDHESLERDKQLPNIGEQKAEEILLQFSMPNDVMSSTFKTEKGASVAFSGQVDMNLLSSTLPGIDQNVQQTSRPQTLMEHFANVEYNQKQQSQLRATTSPIATDIQQVQEGLDVPMGSSIFNRRRKTAEGEQRRHRYTNMWDRRHTVLSKRLKEIDDRLSVLESKEQTTDTCYDLEGQSSIMNQLTDNSKLENIILLQEQLNIRRGRTTQPTQRSPRAQQNGTPFRPMASKQDPEYCGDISLLDQPSVHTSNVDQSFKNSPRVAGTQRGPRPGHNLGFSVGYNAVDQNMNQTPGRSYAQPVPEQSIITDTLHGETFYTLKEGPKQDEFTQKTYTNRTKVNKDKIRQQFSQFVKDAKDPSNPDKRNYTDFARMLIEKHPKIKISDLKAKIRQHNQKDRSKSRQNKRERIQAQYQPAHKTIDATMSSKKQAQDDGPRLPFTEMINEESHLDVLQQFEQQRSKKKITEERPYLAESNNLATAILNDIRKLTTQSEEQTSQKSSAIQNQPNSKNRTALDEKSLGVKYIENQSGQQDSQKINVSSYNNIASNKSMTEPTGVMSAQTPTTLPVSQNVGSPLSNQV